MCFDLNWLERAREELEAATQRLLQIDSYWQKCFPCKNSGKCCIGANPIFSEPDLKAVLSITNEFSDIEKEILSKNIKENKLCPFRANDRCIIHKERTLNCLYTPFQAVITNRNTIMYSMITDKCDFKVIDVPIDKINYEIAENLFIILPSFGVKRHYILLNKLNFIQEDYPGNTPSIDVVKYILDK